MKPNTNGSAGGSGNNDRAIARVLYAMLKQKSLKDIDWNKVASDPVLLEEISNGHAARMRFSRFRSTVENSGASNRRSRLSGASTSSADSASTAHSSSSLTNTFKITKPKRDTNSATVKSKKTQKAMRTKRSQKAEDDGRDVEMGDSGSDRDMEPYHHQGHDADRQAPDGYKAGKAAKRHPMIKMDSHMTIKQELQPCLDQAPTPNGTFSNLQRPLPFPPAQMSPPLHSGGTPLLRQSSSCSSLEMPSQMRSVRLLTPSSDMDPVAGSTSQQAQSVATAASTVTQDFNFATATAVAAAAAAAQYAANNGSSSGGAGEHSSRWVPTSTAAVATTTGAFSPPITSFDLSSFGLETANSSRGFHPSNFCGLEPRQLGMNHACHSPHHQHIAAGVCVPGHLLKNTELVSHALANHGIGWNTMIGGSNVQDDGSSGHSQVPHHHGI